MSISPVSLLPCIFFGTEAEEAARTYVALFPNSSIDSISHFTSAGEEMHKQKPGTVMSVIFKLNGQKFVALNSRPKEMPLTEAVSFQIICEGQADLDHYFNGLTEGITEEDRKKQMCGWLRDRFGVSWQVVPKIVTEVMESGDPKKTEAVMKTFMREGKILVKDVEDAIKEA